MYTVYCASFHFSLGKKTRYLPVGSHDFTECRVLRAPQRPAGLLKQMDESPRFREIALEYLQNDLFTKML